MVKKNETDIIVNILNYLDKLYSTSVVYPRSVRCNSANLTKDGSFWYDTYSTKYYTLRII